MSIAGSSAGGHKGHERVVSKKAALSIIAKLQAGKSSVMAEARRLGVYHATLRKEMRAAIGSKQYDKLVLRGRKKKKPISKGEVLSVIAKVKAGNSSISAERERLGLGSETLPKAMRAAVGSDEYAKLPELKRKTTTKPKTATSGPMAADRFPCGRKRYPKPTPPTFSHVAGEFCCGRCGSDHLKPGTDGNGGGVLWCLCGWTRAIPRMRATAATVV